MSQLFTQLTSMAIEPNTTKPALVSRIQQDSINNGYTIVELNDQKPWGAYFRFDADDAVLKHAWAKRA